MSRGVRTVRFQRTKYGRELLLDAAFLRDMPGFDFSDKPYRLDAHDILLVTRGTGTFELDDRSYEIGPRSLVLTRAGESRRLAVPDLNGACLFFAEEFLSATFADPHFLERFSCLRKERPSAVLHLTRRQAQRFLGAFREMRAEVRALRPDAQEALCAQLYAVLVTIDRFYVARHGPPPEAPPDLVGRFLKLLDDGHGEEHHVGAYARRLGVSASHLSALCRAQLGKGAKACLTERLALEAKRLLLHSDLSVAEIADRLGFDDPAYFARFVRRETGEAPTVLRARPARPRYDSRT
jgi:AraC family transcriptional activator of pobA